MQQKNEGKTSERMRWDEKFKLIMPQRESKRQQKTSAGKHKSLNPDVGN